MDRRIAVICALAFVSGLGLSMAGASSQYQDIGTLADGAYLVQGDEGRFQVSAEEPTGLVVYDRTGQPLDARRMEAGQERTFVLNDGVAVVALFGGKATLGAQGEADVRELGVGSRTLTLARGQGPVDEAFTVQVPPLLVGVRGHLEGTAEGLLVQASTEDGVLFEATEAGLVDLARTVDPAALTAPTVDLTVTAEHMNGTIELTVFQAKLPGGWHGDQARQASQEGQAPSQVTATNRQAELLELANLTGMPIQVDLDEPAQLVVDHDGGFLLDLSVYTEEGDQVHHLHQGPGVAEARQWCRDALDCPLAGDPGWDSLAPTTQEVELDPGAYVVYVRIGAVDGTLDLQDASGESLLDRVDALEPAHVRLTPGTEGLMLDRPVLDIQLYDHDVSGLESLEVLLDDEVVYAYRSTLDLSGQSLDSEAHLEGGLLTAGQLTVDYSAVDSRGLMGTPELHVTTLG